MVTAPAVEIPPPAQPPPARRLRRRLRRARHRHGESRLGDLYLTFLLIVIAGATLPRYLTRYLHHQPQAPAPEATRWWLVTALAVAGAALAWQGLRAFGPLLATPAAQAWCLASPVDRRGWLLTPLRAVLLATAAGAAGLGALGALLAGASGRAIAGAAAGCAGVGAALAGAAVAVQRRPRHWSQRVPVAIGLAGAVAVIALHGAGVVPAAPAPPALWPAVAGLAAGAAGVAGALRRLGRIDRAALAAGAPLAAAVTSAAIFMDASHLSGVLEARRARRAGRVAPAVRALRPGPRWWLLVRAEVRRTARHPGALTTWAGLVLVPYALVLLSPGHHLPGTGRLLAGYLAGNLLATGLRTVYRSPALRRTLGGRDRGLYAAHLVLPAAGTVLWWLGGAGVAPLRPGQLILVAGLVYAVYRNATTKPLRYDGAVAETPMGRVPVDLLRQVLRGLDVVLVLALIQLAVPAD